MNQWKHRRSLSEGGRENGEKQQELMDKENWEWEKKKELKKMKRDQMRELKAFKREHVVQMLKLQKSLVEAHIKNHQLALGNENALWAKLAAAGEELKELKNENINLQGKLTAVLQQKQQIEKYADSIERRREPSVKEMEEMKEQVGEAKEEIAELRREKETLLENINSLKSKLKASEETEKQLRKEKHKLTEKAERHKEQITQLNNKAQCAKSQSEELIKLRNEKQRLEAELKGFRCNAQHLLVGNSEATMERQKCGTCENLKAEMKGMRGELSKAHKENNALKAQISQCQPKISDQVARKLMMNSMFSHLVRRQFMGSDSDDDEEDYYDDEDDVDYWMNAMKDEDEKGTKKKKNRSKAAKKKKKRQQQQKAGKTEEKDEENKEKNNVTNKTELAKKHQQTDEPVIKEEGWMKRGFLLGDTTSPKQN